MLEDLEKESWTTVFGLYISGCVLGLVILAIRYHPKTSAFVAGPAFAISRIFRGDNR